MKYIDVERILTPAEVAGLTGKLNELLENKEIVPAELVDALCAGRLPIELLALLKRTHAEILGEELYDAKSTSTFKPMWELINKDKLSDSEANNLPQLIEPYARELYVMSGGSKAEKNVQSSFFDRYIGDKTIFPREEESIQLNVFIDDLRKIRNFSSHGTGSFSIASAQLAVMAGLLYLTARFSGMLEERLLTADDYVEFDDSVLDTETAMAAAQSCRDNSRRRKAAEALLASRFSATPELAADVELLYELPDPAVEPALAESGLSVLCAPSGSGKTVMLARMAARCTVKQHVLYVPSGRCLVGETPLEQVTNLFLGSDKVLLSPREHYARMRWVNHALTSGYVALLLDSDEPLGPDADVAARLADAYPKLMCVLAAEPGGKTRLPKGAVRCNLQPLGEEDKAQMVRYITLLTHKGIDISQEIADMLATMADDADLSNPFVLTTLLHLLVSDDSLSLTPNFTELIAKFIAAVEANPDIDDSEKRAIMANGMIKNYNATISGVRSKAAELAEIMSRGDSTEALAMLRNSDWMRSDAERRKLFEICHLLREERDLNVLASMAAVAMFGDRPADDPLKPHPALKLLARATVTVPYVRPEADSGNNYGIVYRPAPKYIAEQFTLNLLRLYRRGGVDTDNAYDHVLNVLRTAATLATDEVLDEIFRPYWAVQWLIVEGYTVPGTNITGRAKRIDGDEKSLYNDMFKTPGNPVGLVLRLVQTTARLRMLKAGDAVGFVMNILHSLIRRRMSDRERLALYHSLCDIRGEAALYPQEVGKLCNRTLTYMDVPTSDLPDSDVRYNLDVPFAPMSSDDLNQWRRKCAQHPQSIRLMLKYMMHAYRVGQQSVVADLTSTLIYMKAYKGSSARAFWQTLKQIIAEYGVSAQMRKHLRLIPFDELDAEVAVQIYDPTVGEALVRYRDAMDSSVVRVSTLAHPEPEMLPVAQSVEKGGINSYAYTIYCRPLSTEIVLATQALAGDVAGLYVRFNAGEYWGVVQERLQPVADGRADAYADLSVMLKFAAPLPSTGTIELEPQGRKAFSVRYVAAYPSADGRAAVVRIDDADALRRLAELDGVAVRFAIGEVGGRLTGVRIVPFAPEQTMLRVRLDGVATHVEYPSTGAISLHKFANFKNKNNALGLNIAVDDGSRQPQTGFYKNPFFMAGTYGDHLLWGSLIALYPGTTLRDTATNRLYRVEKNYYLNNSAVIPAEKLQTFRKAADTLKNCRFECLIELVPLYAAKDSKPAYAIRKWLGSGLERVWVQPVVIPEVADAPAVELTVSKVVGTRRILDDGRVALELPDLPELTKKAKRFSIEGVALQLGAEFDSEGRLVPSGQVQPMLHEMESDEVLLSFYARGTNYEPIRFPLPNPEVLFDLSSLNDYPSEFCDVLALYMNGNRQLFEASFQLFRRSRRLADWVKIGLRLGYINDDYEPFALGAVIETNAKNTRIVDTKAITGDKPPRNAPFIILPAAKNSSIKAGDIVALFGEQDIAKLPADLLALLRSRCLCGYRKGRVRYINGKIAIKWSNKFNIYTDINVDSMPDWREFSWVAYLPSYRMLRREGGKPTDFTAIDIHHIS